MYSVDQSFRTKLYIFWITTVAQKFKNLLEKEKRTVRGSALVTLSETIQGFTAERKAKMFGEWTMQHL